MENSTLEIEWCALADLRANPANPRRNEAAVPHVAASLARFGWRQPIVAKSCGEVIAGHTRLLAAIGTTSLLALNSGTLSDRSRSVRQPPMALEYGSKGMIGVLGRSSSKGAPRWLMLGTLDDGWRVAIRREETGDDQEVALPDSAELQRIFTPELKEGVSIPVAGPNSCKIVKSWPVGESELGIWIRAEGSGESEGWDIIVPKLVLDCVSS